MYLGGAEKCEHTMYSDPTNIRNIYYGNIQAFLKIYIVHTVEINSSDLQGIPMCIIHVIVGLVLILVG